MACQNTEFARGIPPLMLNPSTQAATISLDPQQPCPCGTNTVFANCCGPRLDGTAPAQTAEELMRSRYTAHAVCDVAYLLKTWRAPDPRTVEPDTIKQWAQQSDWCGLTIHNTVDGKAKDDVGWVEFSAFFRDKASGNTMTAPPQLHQHREKSYFIQQQEHWYYVEGEVIEKPSRDLKAGRNTLCPCGSGKKFKRCCGV